MQHFLKLPSETRDVQEALKCMQYILSKRCLLIELTY